MIRYIKIIIVFAMASLFSEYTKTTEVPVAPEQQELCASWVEPDRRIAITVNTNDKKLMDRTSVKNIRPIYHDCDVSVWSIIKRAGR